MKLRILLLVCFVFFSTLSSYTQNSGEDKLGTWYIVSGTHKLDTKHSIYTEFQYNTYELASNLEQFWALASFNRNFGDQVSGSLGYGYFSGDPTFEDRFDEITVRENRLFEQLSMRNSYGKLRLGHRYRLENRFFSKEISKVVQHRFRYRLKLDYPLNDKWFVSVFNEIFLSFNDNIFNQNRLFGMLGYRLTKSINVRTGYMKLHFTGRHYDRLQLALTVNTDLSKKQTE